jgi:L-glyceraldehyde 3-phosphate reductase
LDEIPAGSRASRRSSIIPGMLSDTNLDRVRALRAIATERDQKVSQLALSWALRDTRVTSLVIGASSVTQLEENVAALGNMSFTSEELARIDEFAVESEIDLWRGASTS